MAMASTPPARGLSASIKRFTVNALELVQVRLELLATDLEEEKLRLLGALFWAAAALLLLGIGLLLLVIWVLLVFWESHRLAALSALTLVFLGGGVWLAALANARLRSSQGWFSSSRSELARDRAAISEQP